MYQASSASVSLPVSPGDTLEVSHTLVLPHSFPDETCRCRPGKRANAWPRAREPLPACWDLRKVCVSNPGAGKRWPPTPGIQVSGRPSLWALPLPKVLQLLGRGLSGEREPEGTWVPLGDVIVGRERRQNLECLGANEHPWGSLGPLSLLNSSI